MVMSAILDGYDYAYPPELIAQEPAKPRDTARLLVYDRATGRTRYDTFRNLAQHLPPRSVIVLNKTKVIPARVWARKPTGGKVQLFYLRHDRQFWYVLSDHVLADGASVQVGKDTFEVVEKRGSIYAVRPSFTLSRSLAFLSKHGTTPIPPYIKHSPLSERRLRSEYQSVFAKSRGSVAAPTASLHFTPGLLKKLKAAGHTIRYVTLHVGLGTFAPLTPEQLTNGKLHAEHYTIPAATVTAINAAKRSGRPIVAVGTTVARALESAADGSGTIVRRAGETTLFIREGYHFKIIDALITNFHVPRSSLMMLVAALVGRAKLLELYAKAITEKFRLFSFGDGMLIK
jgi:S-adenosylmethionine:tRNA ribosyltransferase-isomerase